MNPDEAFDRLHRAGWSIGDTAFTDGAEGPFWLVSGSNGENVIRAEGVTRGGAWEATVGRTGRAWSGVGQGGIE